MKTLLSIILLSILTLILLGSGCTKIDTPIRDQNSSPDDTSENSGQLTIVPDKLGILDTEPLHLTAKGGSGSILWRCEPPCADCFQPESGSSVLFLPLNITGECEIDIIAEDERKGLSRITIRIVDEGAPPKPGDILLNEIAWAGTLTSAFDEYIEIMNTAERPFYLNNWKIENAAGSGIPLLFSGRIEPQSYFLIANYGQENGKSAITTSIQYAASALSLSNASFGPYILLNGDDEVFDTAGDGDTYSCGLNSPEMKASMSRFSKQTTPFWDPDSWYTESVSVNLSDGSFGTPGAANSNVSLNSGASEDDAQAIITEFAIDHDGSIGEDWAELYITKSGSLKNLIITDLDGEDASITGGIDIEVEQGSYYLVIWHRYEDGWDFDANGYIIEENSIFIPDIPPTGTKDQIVLVCGNTFLDGLCYYSQDNTHFDNDEVSMRYYGWTGDPIHGKYASKRIDEDGDYITPLNAMSWNTEAAETPGANNF